MKDNIVLIGMPGAGKSTLGVLLAKAANYRFMDTDIVIQDRTGQLLYETIEEKGIETNIKHSVNINDKTLFFMAKPPKYKKVRNRSYAPKNANFDCRQTKLKQKRKPLLPSE